MKRASIICGIATSVLASLIGFNVASAAEPIKVGGLFALSGSYAVVGIDQKNTGQYVFDKINAAGGINGRKINFIQADTEGDPTKALLATKRLAEQENVSVIVGPVKTDEGMAIKPYLDSAKVPTVMHCASDIIVDKPPSHWVFKTPPRSSHIVQLLLSYMKDHNLKNIALIYVQNGFGKDALQIVENLAPKYSLNIVGIESFGEKDLDMKPQLLNIRSKKPDALLVWTIGPSGSIVTKNMRELDYNVSHFQGHGSATYEFIKIAGPAAEGVMIGAQKIFVGDDLANSDPQKPVIAEFVRGYTKAYSEPGAMAACGADAANIIVEALKKAGDNRAAIRDSIESTKNLVGLNGIYNMSPSDHNGLSPNNLVIIKVHNGKFALVKN